MPFFFWKSLQIVYPVLYRLIKGDGEVIEEMVSRDRHMKINKDSTLADGHTFQMNTVGLKKP